MLDKKREASKIDALYSWISYDLQKMKEELGNEMRLAKMQVTSLNEELKQNSESSSRVVAQEIRYSYKQNQTIYDGLANMISGELKTRLEEICASAQSLNEKQDAIQKVLEEAFGEEGFSQQLMQAVENLKPQIQEAVGEFKYNCLQQQAIYSDLKEMMANEVIAKFGDFEDKFLLLEKIDATLNEINDKLYKEEEEDYKELITSVVEKTEESISLHTREVLDSIENVDYIRIADEVGDKVLDVLAQVGINNDEEKEITAVVDYDKIAYGTAEKVVESLPYPEKVDYRRISNDMVKAVAGVQLTEEVIASKVQEAVEKAFAGFNVDALAEMVASKIEVPTPQAPTIDYDLLSNMVVEKLANASKKAVLCDESVDEIVEKVAQKCGEGIDYDRIASTIDYDRISAIVEEKLANQPEEEVTYELMVDDEGVDTIAKKVAEELTESCVCQKQEEVVTETVEETVEEVVEEVVEETVEEVVEPESPAVEEIAVSTTETVEEAVDFQETMGGELVDAETGLVIRLKKSFTAKMKQSEEQVKEYYSDIKNELKSYKKINSNISWHGDRFNYGRETIAHLKICGKTLCFYLALDPENPEFKTTVYHQKNVGEQRAYANTPFMVKVKSDAAVKKALRLVGYLADKVGTTKLPDAEKVDYVSEFAYESTKKLFDAGYIKATKEKKIDLDF